MELSGIKGLGSAKQNALRQAGIANVQDLAAIDLREGGEVQGVTQEALKGLKQRARKVLAADGTPGPKAPYTRNVEAQGSMARMDVVTDLGAKPVQPTEPANGGKRGFLRRILTRRS